MIMFKNACAYERQKIQSDTYTHTRSEYLVGVSIIIIKCNVMYYYILYIYVAVALRLWTHKFKRIGAREPQC